MNKQIKELFEQAKAESSQWLGSKPAIAMTYDGLERFAELIVAECLVTLDSIVCDTSGERDTLWVARKVVADHFGVE